MPKCNDELFEFPSFDRRKIEASFQGGEVSSDGGAMLLREADRRLGLSKALDAALPDPGDPELITHAQIDLLRQRIYGLAGGYEDINDHDTLRHDLAWQSAVERDTALGKQSDVVPARSAGQPPQCGGDARGAAQEVHRFLCRGARGAGARFRRHR